MTQHPGKSITRFEVADEKINEPPAPPTEVAEKDDATNQLPSVSKITEQNSVISLC